MMRVPLPRERLDPGRSGVNLPAGRVVPFRDATGAQLQDVGQSAVKLGASITQYADQQQDIIDDADSKHAINAYMDVQRQSFEAEGGYLNTLGRDATGARREQAFKDLEKHRRKLRSSLGNEVQRRLFDQEADELDLRRRFQADKHESEQTLNYRIGEGKARADNQYRIAGEATGEDREEAKGIAIRESQELSRLLGEGPEKAAERVREGLTTMHEITVNRLVKDGRASEAAEYVKANRGEMDPRAADRLGSMAQGATVAQESTRLSMNWMEIARKRGGTLEQQRDYAIAIADQTFKGIPTSGKRLTPEVRDETIQRIEVQYRRNKQSEAAADNEVFKQATDALLADPLASPNDLPPEMRDELKARGLTGDLNAWASSGKRFVTDPKAAAEVWTLLETPGALDNTTPDELVRRYRGRLDDREMNLLLAGAAKARGQATKDHISLLTENERVMEAFHRATGTPRNKELTDEQQQRRYLYKQRVGERLNGERESLTPERFQEILDETTIDTVFVDVTGSDPSGNIYALADDNYKNAYVQVGDKLIYASQNGDASRLAVPSEERAKIVSELRARRMPTTQQAISELWVQGGMQGRK
jgi:hypothetical protein